MTFPYCRRLIFISDMHGFDSVATRKCLIWSMSYIFLCVHVMQTLYIHFIQSDLRGNINVFFMSMLHGQAYCYTTLTSSIHAEDKKSSFFYPFSWPVKKIADFHSPSTVQWTREKAFLLGVFSHFFMHMRNLTHLQISDRCESVCICVSLWESSICVWTHIIHHATSWSRTWRKF